MSRNWILSLVCLVAACAPAENDLGNSSYPPKASSAPSASDPPGPPPEPGVSLSRQTINLLPFEVRLNKLAQVLGVQADHEVLTPVRAARFELGDHDYANGIPPDRNWSSNRLSVWVRVLLPVCQSELMKQRYQLTSDLGSFVQAAYGRPMTAQDEADLRETTASVTDSDERYRLTCLSVLSSLEFVAR